MFLLSKLRERALAVGIVVAAAGTLTYVMRAQVTSAVEGTLRRLAGDDAVTPQQPSAIHTRQQLPDPHNPPQHSEPHPYETEDLYFHDDLVGKDMRDPAVIRAAREALVPPAWNGPLFLENPRATFYSQAQQDQYVKKIFNNKRGGFFLEAGALTGEALSNTLHLERVLGWTGVLMEPTPNSYHVLKSKNRKAYLMRACIATGSQYSELNLKMGRRVWTNSLTDASTQNTVKVPCYPLYSVLAALGNPVVDYLSLDVEGVDLEVLQSIPWHLVNIRVMTVETGIGPERRDAVRNYMEAQGFKFVTFLTMDSVFVNPKLSDGLNLNA